MLCIVGDGTDYASRIGQALDAALYYRGVEIGDLADRIGVNRATIYRWLRGETDMSAAHAAAIVETLDTPPELFVRPPETRARALAMLAAYDALREAGSSPGPSLP
jgi:transcriptional regulator with XRE-family HTH domain